MLGVRVSCKSVYAKTVDLQLDPDNGKLSGAIGGPTLLSSQHTLPSQEVVVADDHEGASMEGWLKRNILGADIVPGCLSLVFWRSWFFRLEHGPRRLSFYRSEAWQGHPHEGAFDLNYLVAVHVVPAKSGRLSVLVLTFSRKSEGPLSIGTPRIGQVGTSTEPVDMIRLAVPSAQEAASWQRHLVDSIELQLLDACEQCATSELAVDRATRISRHARIGAAEGHATIDLDRARRGSSDSTALMLAAQADHKILCARLVKAKADPRLKNADGKTAVELAASAHHSKFAARLAERLQAVLTAELEDKRCRFLPSTGELAQSGSYSSTLTRELDPQASLVTTEGILSELDRLPTPVRID